MNPEQEQRIQKRLAQRSEAELARWISTYEQIRATEVASGHPAHAVMRDEVDEATWTRWMTTFEQMHVIDAKEARKLQMVLTDQVADIIAMLRQELQRRILQKAEEGGTV